jgi:CDP-diacylglycerol--glycerol-3-phosphate 3-phosphatidyltransferase
MNLANKLTLFRIILAPIFLIIYFLPRSYSLLTVPILIIIYIISEITDYFDGLAARKLNLTSDFGKFFDPFADSLVQITYFLCFLIDGIWGSGIFPMILFLIVIYRECSILFLRNLMLKKGITQGARMGGKIKTVSYIVTGSAALLAATLERLAIYEPLTVFELFLPYVKTAALVIFFISVIIAIVSFIDYLLIYRKTGDV